MSAPSPSVHLTASNGPGSPGASGASGISNRSASLSDGFINELRGADPDEIARRVHGASPARAAAALARGGRSVDDFAALLSPAAARGGLLEGMARRAREITLRHFGRTIQLFTPLYLSNHCANRCRYCGFNAGRGVPRRRLSGDEIEAEARAIAASGLRQVLALTGEAPALAGPDYIVDAVGRLSRHFPSVGVEVYALSRDDYGRLVEAGVENMTMFQETYHPALYAYLHPAGPKADFAYRIDAPARAAAAGMRSLGLGALLGLDDWRRDLYWTARHAAWLERRFPGVTVGFSLPRLRPLSEAEGGSSAAGGEADGFSPRPVDDRSLVQALAALRLFMPTAPITISSRERAGLRDRLIDMGATRMSAGVCTAVGGHAISERGSGGGAPQFEIDDGRSVGEMVGALSARGYQAVMKDWEPLGAGEK